MSTYETTKILILNGAFKKESMMKKLDIFLNLDRITLEEYEELIDLMK